MTALAPATASSVSASGGSARLSQTIAVGRVASRPRSSRTRDTASARGRSTTTMWGRARSAASTA